MKSNQAYKEVKHADRRKRIIQDVINLCTIFYPNDEEMLNGVIGLTSDLAMAEWNQTTIEFVDGMYGFMLWADNRNDVNSRSVFTTLVHDLGEFSRNRHENWFCPRTSGYTKYLSGASGVTV